MYKGFTFLSYHYRKKYDEIIVEPADEKIIDFDIQIRIQVRLTCFVQFHFNTGKLNYTDRPISGQGKYRISVNNDPKLLFNRIVFPFPVFALHSAQ